MTKREQYEVIESWLKGVKVSKVAAEELLNHFRPRVAKPKREIEIEVDGQGYRWCTRHKQYEPIEWFLPHPKDKNKLRPECAPATYRWVDYGKKINKAVRTGDAAAIGELTLTRKGPYNLEADLEEFKDKLGEIQADFSTDRVITEDLLD